jgi:protein TonB
MNRLQKKCAIFSASLHALLLGILLFGAALMPDPDQQTAFKPLTVYSAAAVSDALTSGGEPSPVIAPVPPVIPPVAKPLPPVIPRPVVQPKPEPRPEPAPKERVKETELTRPEPKIKPQESWHLFNWSKKKTEEPKEETPAPAHVHTPHRIVIDPASLKEVVRKHDHSSDEADQQAQNDRAARAERRRVAQKFAEGLRSISQNMSSSTVVQMPSGGTGGELSVNYRDIIASKYYNAWVAPSNLEPDSRPVLVSVTIARDGSVINAHIIHLSGNSGLDRSIQNALDAVTFIEPFPATSHDEQRTVTISFNLQIKQQTG